MEIVAKKRFSMLCGNESTLFLDGSSGNGRNQVILCGIEGHVCVLQVRIIPLLDISNWFYMSIYLYENYNWFKSIYQTALDLIEKGLQVHLVCDAISSQRYYYYDNLINYII